MIRPLEINGFRCFSDRRSLRWSFDAVFVGVFHLDEEPTPSTGGFGSQRARSKASTVSRFEREEAPVRGVRPFKPHIAS